MTPQQSVVTGLIDRFPKAATQTLAKIAYKEHPSLFRDVEGARSAFRLARGNCGKKNRHGSACKERYRPNQLPGDPFVKIPEGKRYLDDWSPVEISGPARALVLSDIHFPYHDRAALRIALSTGRDRQANMLILNGDTCDFFSVSHWEKDPRQRDFPAEVASIKEFLALLRSGFPKARIVFKEGNHEERYVRYMTLKAPELLGLPDFELRSVLGLDAVGAEHIGDKRPIRLGKLNVIHGHEYKFPIANPVNPARGYYLRAKTHCIGGHLHQTSQHSEKTLEGKVLSTWSTGCLCDLHPEYRPLNNWNHGFAFVEIDKAGVFHVDNLKIIDGKAY